MVPSWWQRDLRSATNVSARCGLRSAMWRPIATRSCIAVSVRTTIIDRGLRPAIQFPCGYWRTPPQAASPCPLPHRRSRAKAHRPTGPVSAPLLVVAFQHAKGGTNDVAVRCIAAGRETALNSVFHLLRQADAVFFCGRRPLDHRGAGTAPAPALLVCFRLPAGFAAEFVDRDTMLPTGPMSVLVTELTGEDAPTDERESWAVPAGLLFSLSGLSAC